MTNTTQSLDRVWSQADPVKLLEVARDIDSRGSWVAYLSNQEYSLFHEAINQGPTVWTRFLNGDATCIVDCIEPASGENADPTTTSITFDSLVLAFRVRYMLYEKCLPVLYPETGAALDLSVSNLLMDNTVAGAKRTTNISSGLATVTSTFREEDNYDDDYDEDDEDNDENSNNVPLSQNGIPNESTTTNNDSVTIRVTTNTTSDNDGQNQSQNQKAIIDAASETYARTYHLFDNDRENTVKQKKLQESDRQMDSYVPSTNGSERPIDSHTAQFGAANLSLKHLLAAIDGKRDDLSLTDMELRNLIMDVRKNRSKWASEEKIGQEELYEAAEKVVLELRGYTEHSTAFLNKVSKREAPNYFSVIKHPMDLNTVMKKLKGFQYNSKHEFVDDLMLIWSNCLTYNSDPNHFLRAHALAMQKKTISLIPLIPDIKVRNRAEVEAEERAANPTTAMSDDEEDEASHGKHSTKGRKRKLDHNEESDKATKSRKKPDGNVPQEVDTKNQENSASTTGKDKDTKDASKENKERSLIDQKIDELNEQQGRRVRSATPNTPWSPGSEIDTELTETLKEESSNQNNTANARGAYEEDLETQMWQKLYSKQRAEYCEMRATLFTKEDKLAMDSAALLRLPVNMAKFGDTTANMFRSLDDYHQSRAFLLDSLGSVERPAFIVEYEVNSGLPPIPEAFKQYSLFDDPDNDNEDDIETGLRLYNARQNTDRSDIFITRGGTGSKIDSNLAEMQYIRKVCSKISLIRQMQQPSYVPTLQVDTTALTTDDNVPQKRTKKDPMILDALSSLPTHDPFNDQVCSAVMRKLVAKLAMHQGFEFCEVAALDCLQEIAADFMGKLGRTLCMYLEEPDDIRQDSESMVQSTLRDNGIPDAAALDFYVNNGIDRFGTKIRDLKRNITSYMAELLRPIGTLVNEFTDKQFTDDSEQFLSGDFSTELGDDYFGFRELGLDRELGLLSNAVPFHLLQGRLNASLNRQLDKPVDEAVMQTVPDYPSVDQKLAERQIGLLKSFFVSRLEAIAPVQRERALAQGHTHPHIHLIEGDLLPPKQRNTRPRLPPTGKIAGPKRRSYGQMFVIPVPPPPTPSPSVKASPMENGTDNFADGQLLSQSQKTLPDASVEIDMDDLDRSLDMIV